MKFTRLVFLTGFLALSAGVASAQNFAFGLDALQENPPNASPASGTGLATLSGSNLTLHVDFAGLVAPQTAAHIHAAPPGVNGSVIIPLPNGSPIDGVFALTSTQRADLLAGNLYVNVHSTNFPGGEIRGQIVPEPGTLGLLLVAGLGLLRRR